MEHQKILNLLNDANDSKFVTRKWNIDNDNSKTNYGVGNQIMYNTEVWKPNLCHSNDAYILVKGDNTIATGNLVTEVAFKNCTPFTNCNAKIDGKVINGAENLDLVMPMYNLIDCSSNYSKTMKQLILKIKLQILMILNHLDMRLKY